jgi:beta-lactamase regulating signal transducer with metallopeptidase domain
MSIFILETVLKSSVVIAAAAAVNLILQRRASAAWRHLVWTLAVAGLLAVPALSMLLPRLEVPILTGPVQASVSAPENLHRESFSGADAIPSRPARFIEASGTLLNTASNKVAAPGLNSRMSWPTMLVIVYFSGVLFFVARLFVSRWSVRALARNAKEVSDPAWTALLSDCESLMGIDRPVRLLRSLDATMPMAFGTRRATILLPSIADTWTEDRRRAVLLHELAHISRHDCLTQLAAAVTCAVYWMHPGAWLVARRLRMERELACDDRVLAIGTHARDYAGHLLELAYTLGGTRAPALTVSMARQGQIEGRMLAVLDAARNRAIPALRGFTICAAVAAAILVPLAAAEATFPAETAIVNTGANVPSARDTALVAETSKAPETPAQDRRQDRNNDPQLPGTWTLRPADDGREVNIQLHERRNSTHGFTITIDKFEGLSQALAGGTSTAKFTLRRDAGTFSFEGTFRSGVGGGTYTFTPNGAFVDELVKRGFSRPTAAEQYRLAAGDVGFKFLEELTAQRYAKPDLAQLIRSAEHGVNLEYLQGMAQAGHRLGQLDALIKMRDHGVDPEFIHGMEQHGLKGLSADEHVRLRDHGVDPHYVSEMKALGHRNLGLEDLVRARDHGVDPEHIRSMQHHGFDLSLEEHIKGRDHGVDAGFIKALQDLGFNRLGMEDLVRMRDHGVDPKFIREMGDAGYKRLSIDELVRLRDHGVSPEWAKRQNSQRRTQLSIDELIRIRDRGGE